MNNNQKPSSPNFDPTTNPGRLTTDRYEFESHLEGVNPSYVTIKNFRHNATQVDLLPDLTINSIFCTTVQEALEALQGSVAPTIPIASNTAPGLIQLSGDLSGNNNGLSPKVSGIQGFPISTLTPTTGYVLTWNGTAWAPAPGGGGGGPVTLFGDVTGSSSSNTVIRINGATVPVAGSLTIGNVLQVTGTSALGYGPVNLAGGSNYVIGNLPVANLPNLGGDVTGTIISNTVSKLQNYPVNLIPGSTTGQVLTWNGSAWIAGTPTGVTWANDLLGSNNTHQWVGSISGAGGLGGTINVSADAFLFDKTQPTPTITQAALTADTAAQLMLIQAQSAYASASTNVTGAALELSSGFGKTHNSDGVIHLQTGGVDKLLISGATAGVIKVPNTTLAGNGDGYVAVHNDGTLFWSSGTGSGGGGSVTLAGDVTGPSGSNTVVKINGASVPAAGGLVTGNVLQVTGASSLGYGPLNLSNVNAVTGTLPVGNLPNMGGDVSGIITANTLAKIQGINLVIGSLTSGQVIQYNGTNWVNATVGGGGVSWNNDLAGSTSSNQWVTGLSGHAGGGGAVTLATNAWIGQTAGHTILETGGFVALSTDGGNTITLNSPGGNLHFQSGGTGIFDVFNNGITIRPNSNFSLEYVGSVSGAGSSLHLQPQQSTANVGGSVFVDLFAPGSGTTESSLTITRGGTFYGGIGPLSGGIGTPTCALYLNPTGSWSSGDFTLYGDADGNTVLNAAGEVTTLAGTNINNIVNNNQVWISDGTTMSFDLPVQGDGITFPWNEAVIALSGSHTLAPSEYACRFITVNGTIPSTSILTFPGPGEWILDCSQLNTTGGSTFLIVSPGKNQKSIAQQGCYHIKISSTSSVFGIFALPM